ncbi:MAG: phosphate ABC transporter ATP-binding protein PstB [Alphaproteobacteria bacterium]|jgi:phosphate transport system ATP-binding protein|nr:phosphate ABC transporter ATP-binding protein PstB [Alphaproteobacteria bacterium]
MNDFAGKPFAEAYVAQQPGTNEFEQFVETIPPESTKVDIRGLDFFYMRNQALYSVSLPVAQNAVTAIVGPSGCGKSTLLRVINRIYALYPGQRAEGQVMLDGQNILDRSTDLPWLRSRVGMVFQQSTPFPMSIYDNVAFGVRLYENLHKAELSARVEESLRRSALWEEVKDKLETSALGLSGGQQQRLCVARSVAVRPEVLLLDEPASALDPISTAKLEETIVELKRDISIAIVTHNLQQAARVSDHTAFMFLGRLIEYGSTERVFNNPRTSKAADYVTGRFG